MHGFVRVRQCVMAGTSSAAGRGGEQRQEEEIGWFGKSKGEGMLRRDNSLLALYVFYRYTLLLADRVTREGDTLHHVPAPQPQEGFS